MLHERESSTPTGLGAPSLDMSLAESVALWVCLALLVWVALALLGLSHQLTKLEFEIFQIRQGVEQLQNQLGRSTDRTLNRIDRVVDRLGGAAEDSRF